MEKSARKKLKQFLQNNIPFSDLKKAGFFQNDIRKTDYEKISERVCSFFGLKSIYEYKLVCNGENCHGNCILTSQFCKSYGINKWKHLEINYEELYSEDKWLN